LVGLNGHVLAYSLVMRVVNKDLDFIKEGTFKPGAYTFLKNLGTFSKF
jgi:hypothetical protein